MSLFRSLTWMLLIGVPALAQPVIRGVTNAASFAASGLPNGDIALGSMFGRIVRR